MLLNKLNIVTAKGQNFEVPLEEPSDGYFVKDIQGLGPVKATLVSSSFANMDGSQYHSSRREDRNIVISLGLDPDLGETSAHKLREWLYWHFMPKSEVQLKFRSFDRFATNVLYQYISTEIVGRVESIEPTMFTKTPGIDISIICFDPDFVSPVPLTLDGFTTDTLDEIEHMYWGTADTGVLFKLFVDRPLNEFSIYHRTSDNKLYTVYLEHPLVAGQEVHINSMPGDKYASLIDNGVETSLLHALSPQSAWLSLIYGGNFIRVYAEGAPVPFSMTYNTRLGGI